MYTEDVHIEGIHRETKSEEESRQNGDAGGRSSAWGLVRLQARGLCQHLEAGKHPEEWCERQNS